MERRMIASDCDCLIAHFVKQFQIKMETWMIASDCNCVCHQSGEWRPAPACSKRRFSLRFFSYPFLLWTLFLIACFKRCLLLRIILILFLFLPALKGAFHFVEICLFFAFLSSLPLPSLLLDCRYLRFVVFQSCSKSCFVKS